MYARTQHEQMSSRNLFLRVKPQKRHLTPLKSLCKTEHSRLVTSCCLYTHCWCSSCSVNPILSSARTHVRCRNLQWHWLALHFRRNCCQSPEKASRPWALTIPAERRRGFMQYLCAALLWVIYISFYTSDTAGIHRIVSFKWTSLKFLFSHAAEGLKGFRQRASVTNTMLPTPCFTLRMVCSVWQKSYGKVPIRIWKKKALHQSSVSGKYGQKSKKQQNDQFAVSVMLPPTCFTLRTVNSLMQNQ